MKTIIHCYSFDISTKKGAADCRALRAKMKAANITCFESSGTHYRPELDGREIELDDAHLFENQWNTAPIEGFSEKGYRLFDWAQEYLPGTEIERGYYLDITPEMIEARRNRYACGFCGKQEPAAKGYVFCPHCLSSEYLKPEDLHLTRMQSVADTTKRAPLTEAERAHLMPLYTQAQINGSGPRSKAYAAAQREKVMKRAASAIAEAQIKEKGFLWLLDRGLQIDNCIYYSHTNTFSFGWRSPVSDSVRDALLDVISEFPFPYEIKCADGKTLEGY